MRLRKLTLRNWCQYRERVIEFKDGVNLIIGRNGAGKSNIITAWLFCLTGETGRNVGVKSDNVNDQASPSEQAFVIGEFEHNGVFAELKRNLKGTSTKLTLRDKNGNLVEEPTTSDTKVTARVMALLKTRPEILRDYVFVQQLKLFAPFDPNVKPADRASAMQELFEYGRFEELYDALGEAINGLPLVTLPPLGPLEDNVRRLTLQRDQQSVIVAQNADLEGWTYANDPDHLLCQRYANGAAVRNQLNAAQQAYDMAVQAHAVQAPELRVAQDTVTVLENGLAQVSTVATRWREAVAWSQTYHRAMADAEAHRRSVVDAENLWQQQVAVTNATAADAAQATVQLAEQSHRLEELLASMAVLKSQILPLQVDASVCPTCQRPIEGDMRTQLVTMKQQYDAEEGTVRSLRVSIPQLQTRVELGRRETATLQHMQHRLDVIRQQPAAAAVEVKFSETEVQQAIAGLAQVVTTEQQLATARQQLNMVQSYVNRLSANVATAEQQLQAAMALAAQNPPVSDQEYAAAHQSLQNKQGRSSQLVVAKQVLHEASWQLQQATTQYTAVKMQHDAVAIQAAQRAELLRLREFCHRDNLPKTLVRQQLKTLQENTNAALSSVNMDFRVTTDETGCNYDANFTNGSKQPVARLSPGLQTMFAVSFRIALNGRLANELNLLSLDEPTTSLDQQNRKFLEPAIQALQSFSQTRGLQCIIITHEPVPGAEHTICV